KAEQPDVILSDVRMPGLDGFQLTEAFRADPAVASTAIVLNSATVNEEEDKALALKLGAQDYIDKGLAPDALATALTTAIGRAAADASAASREACQAPLNDSSGPSTPAAVPSGR